jgi:hypothetical protein
MDTQNTPTPKKPRSGKNFMPWPFQAATIALLAALGVAALVD